MTDGTGKTSYIYDQLDRLTENKDGHGNKTSYEYDLANEQTKITYPNGKAVTRTYDKDGRLQKVADWSEHATKFAYDADSNLTATTFPTETRGEDAYAYNEADQMTEVKIIAGSETRAAITYTRDSDGQVKAATVKGLPGEEKPSYTYDENNRLTKAGGTAWEYDNANNPTKIGSNTYTYGAAGELEKSTSVTYTYDKEGERTKRTPTSGSATTYGYDQAGDLTSVTQPEEGTRAAIKDIYTYDGNGLRATQSNSEGTRSIAWDVDESTPQIINDGQNGYIYGPDGIPIEQINAEGKVLYLHHDQQGSTRLLTGQAGSVEGTTTYDPYGNLAGSTGSKTTPFGYDGQYTNTDTGLIYLRARSYDPATAQFLSTDPIVPITRTLYTYAEDNPLTLGDPTGLWTPTESLEKFSNEIGEEISNAAGGFVGGLTEGLIEGSGKPCSTGYTIGEYGALALGALLPEDFGAELFQKFAARFPKLGLFFVKQQADQPVTQPGKLFILKSAVEKLLHLFGG